MGKLFLVALIAVGGFFAAVLLASDFGGEVVTLTTTGKGGSRHDTKVWIVEDHNQLWIRAGQPASAWLLRLQAEPRVTMTRNGESADYRAVVVPKQQERINRLMAEDYGWADTVISVMRDSGETTAIRLDPVR